MYLTLFNSNNFYVKSLLAAIWNFQVKSISTFLYFAWYFVPSAICHFFRETTKFLSVRGNFRNFHTVHFYSVWKNKNLTEKNFVQSTRYLVFSLVKPLLSRNFRKKWKLYFHRHFYSSNQLFSNSFITVWKRAIKRDHDLYGKNNIFSVKSMFLLQKLVKSWFHEIFFCVMYFVVLFHTVEKKLSIFPNHSVDISVFFCLSVLTWNPFPR